MFYTDFLSYKLYGMGMSGLAYKAIQYAPVPQQWVCYMGPLMMYIPESNLFIGRAVFERLFR